MQSATARSHTVNTICVSKCHFTAYMHTYHTVSRRNQPKTALKDSLSWWHCTRLDPRAQESERRAFRALCWSCALWLKADPLALNQASSPAGHYRRSYGWMLPTQIELAGGRDASLQESLLTVPRSRRHVTLWRPGETSEKHLGERLLAVERVMRIVKVRLLRGGKCCCTILNILYSISL